MRVYQTGFERGTSALELLSVVGDISFSTSSPHVDSKGNGGAGALRVGGPNATNVLCPTFAPPVVQARLRWFIWPFGSTPRSFLWQAGGALLGYVRVDHVASTITIFTGSGTQVATAPVAVSAGVWHKLEVDVTIHDSLGSIDVYLDDPGTYLDPVVSFDGDTKPGADTAINRIGISAGPEILGGYLVDDVAVNAPTLSYDGGSGGAPAVGDTVTGVTSTHTATVGAVDGDATSGILYLWGVSGPFLDDEVIETTAGSGTLDAFVNAPEASYEDGLMPNSGLPGTGFIVSLRPTGNGNSSQLLGSDGNNTDNYLLVDEQPMSSADYVEADTDGEQDTYAMGDLPASAGNVNTVFAVLFASKDGESINTATPLLRLDSTDYPGDPIALPGSDGPLMQQWLDNPDTGDVFQTSEVNDLEAGVRFNA